MSLDVYLSKNKCEHCGRSDEGFSANITHNLSFMAAEAGIYQILWRPDENEITYAKQMIKPLRIAIAEMKDEPERFKKHNAPNGWGVYEDFVPWLEKYLAACEANPESTIKVSR
jgi:hypothetical protein